MESATIYSNTMGIEDETDRTLFIRNLDPRVTEELLFELFLQVLLSLTLAIVDLANVKCMDSIMLTSRKRFRDELVSNVKP